MSLGLFDVSVGPKGRAPLFLPVSLQVAGGEVATLMGPSGIGKSTLLDAIGGHLVYGFAVSGRVELAGRDMLALPTEARRIGVLFQDAMLFPHLSVGDNLAFGLARGVRGAARRAAVEEALEQAGLAGFAGRDPATLSGGQRARAALMRALLAEPLALLLDEPFSRLDKELRAEIRAFVFDHLRARAIPALMVTHDASDAEAAGGVVVQL
ncbi:putative thiamine transport system ATP-binding protein [Pseudorhodobacter antarcticus]|jgi:putative thiamine transport system ATP-binding protein|uniref:Putative thiamine transport system ATP-binding protein n=1 Tax=Pseudorhodobacter antarcticus TaxID=1077947 RepID=A0A1H8INE5_9RHOB|nr:ATP-binding cassette domain-containing protein [Pseudorhodobacter antarcticus]SEN70470.1 putative thiamine transport system ATP-binding protein [Pseudorhodobacter antarcticus]